MGKGLFSTGTGLREDNHQMLDNLLQVGAYDERGGLDKAKIIFDNALDSWRDIKDYTSADRQRAVNNSFLRGQEGKGSIDIAKDYEIPITDVPLLRTANNPQEAKEIADRLHERHKREREAGLVSSGSSLWAGVNVGANILTDPLLIPSILLPELALSKLGTVTKVAGGAAIDAGLQVGYDAIDFLATHQEKDRGDTVAGILISGLTGGAFQLMPKGFTDVKAGQEVQKVISKSLVPYGTRDIQAMGDIMGQVAGFKKGWMKNPITPSETIDLRGKLWEHVKNNFTQDEIIAGLKKMGDNFTMKNGEYKVPKRKPKWWGEAYMMLEGRKPKPKEKAFESKFKDISNAERVKNASKDEAKQAVQNAFKKQSKPIVGYTKEEIEIADRAHFHNQYDPIEIDEAIKYLKKNGRKNEAKDLLHIKANDIDHRVGLDIMDTLLNDGSKHLDELMKLGDELAYKVMNGKATAKEDFALNGITHIMEEYFNRVDNMVKPIKKDSVEYDQWGDKVLDNFGSSPFVLALGALGLGSTIDLEASDGSSSYNPIDAILALGMGIMAFKYRRGLKDVGRNLWQKKNLIKRIDTEAMGVVGGTKSFFKKIAKLDSIEFESTVKLANIMLDNIGSIMHRKDKTIASSASQEKEILKTQILSKAFSQLTELYGEYKKEIGFKSLNPMRHAKNRDEFYKKIGTAYTLRNWGDLPQSVIKSKAVFDQVFEDFRVAMIDAGVEGIEDMKTFKDYFPRYHNPRTYDYVHSLGSAQVKTVSEWYAKAIQRGFKGALKSDITDETALKMANKLMGFGKEDSYIQALKEDQLFTKYEDFENMEDYFNRAKFRIPIDFNIPALKLENGETLNMVDFVETNAFSVMGRYSNSTSGHYAFGKMGIPNIANHLKKAETEFNEHGGDSLLWRDIKDYADLILGRPITNLSDVGLHNLFTTMQKATVAQYLHLSGIGALSEAIPAGARAMLNGHLGEAWSTFKKLNGTMLKDIATSKTDEIAQELGVGFKRVLAREGLANVRIQQDDIWTVGGKLTDTLDQILTPMKRFTFLMNQLPAIDDFSNLMNIKTLNDRLMKHIETGKYFNKRRLKTLGLTDDKIKLLKEQVKKHVNNDRMNFDKWDEQARKIYSEAMISMKRAYVGDPALGDLPLIFLRSPLMKVLGTLLSYPIQSFDNALLRDVYARDSEAIFRFMNMSVSTAISMQMRDMVNNKDRSDETTQEFMERLIMKMPHMALIEMGASLFQEKDQHIDSLFPSLGVLVNAVETPRSLIDIGIGEAQAKDYKHVLQMLSVPMFMGKIISEFAVPPKNKTHALEAVNATVGGLK